MAGWALLLPWSYFVARLGGAVLGLEMRASLSRPNEKEETTLGAVTAATFGTWCFVMSIIWMAVWGFGMGPGNEAPLLLLIGATAIQHASKNVTKAQTAPGPRAAWCMLARAAGLPPRWRVEQTFEAKRRVSASVEESTRHGIAATRRSPRKKAD